jgi:hypothetical protein
VSKTNNLRVARDAGYRARYKECPRTANPFPQDDSWSCYRGAWYDGWDKAQGENQ